MNRDTCNVINVSAPHVGPHGAVFDVEERLIYALDAIDEMKEAIEELRQENEKLRLENRGIKTQLEAVFTYLQWCDFDAYDRFSYARQSDDPTAADLPKHIDIYGDSDLANSCTNNTLNNMHLRRMAYRERERRRNPAPSKDTKDRIDAIYNTMVYHLEEYPHKDGITMHVTDVCKKNFPDMRGKDGKLSKDKLYRFVKHLKKDGRFEIKEDIRPGKRGYRLILNRSDII